MKKFLLAILITGICSELLSQPLTGIKSIPGNYSSLAEAIVDLNTNGVGAGGVTFNVTAGHIETAPLGGYEILASGTSDNPIIFQKSGVGDNPEFMAFSPQFSGRIRDAVFKIIGADYVTIDGFTIIENPLNTISETATNNMTEFGIALFYWGPFKGSQYATIKNCEIELNRDYRNTFGIYSNNMHNSLDMTGNNPALSPAGNNTGLSIKGNSISNVNLGIVVIGPSGSNEHNNEVTIGGSETDGNTITNFGTTGTFSAYAGMISSVVSGIVIKNVRNATVTHNSITSSDGGTIAGSLRGIYFPSANTLQTTAFTKNISNNSISLKSGIGNQAMVGISIEPSTTNEFSNRIINENEFHNFGYTVAASGAVSFIVDAGFTLNTDISRNTFKDLSLNTTGNVFFISRNTTMPVGGLLTVNKNRIVNSFEKTLSGGGITFFTTSASSPEGSTIIQDSNDFSNITLTGTTGISGWINTDGGAPEKTITNNRFTNISIGSGGSTLMNVGFSGKSNVSGNVFDSITATGLLIVINTGSGTDSISSNTISNISTTGTTLTGINITGGTTKHISNNTIRNLTATLSNALVRGVIIGGGSNVFVFNNFISELKAPSTSNVNAVEGIRITSGLANSIVGIYYNTIYLNATSIGTNFGTSGIFQSYNLSATAAALDLRNNIIVNMSTPNNTGLTVALRRSAATNLNNYSVLSNSNLFYAGTPAVNRLIFNDGTNSDQTIEQFKSRVDPREASSVTELPPFNDIVNPPYDLSINTTIATQIEAGGLPVTTPIEIANDFFGNMRNVSFPDIGADEFDGIPLDLTPPSISYAALSNTSLFTSRTLTATIIDQSGVPTLGIGLPVLYWSINNVAGPFTPVTATHVSASNYEFEFGNGVTTGDVVYYYIAAQDMASTPNVGTSPSANASGFTLNPPAASTPPTNPHSYTISPSISGTVLVGVGETYTSLTADSPSGLFKAINNGFLTGDLNVEIVSDITETGQIALNKANEEALYTITIRPDGTTNRNITGNFNGGLIRLNGTENVIIDGSFNNEGRYLTFSNTSIAFGTAVFHIFNSASGNTIRNCNIIAGSNTINSCMGIYLGFSAISTSSSEVGSNLNNNVIENNSISKAYYGILARGGAAGLRNVGLKILNNEIGSDHVANYVRFRGIEISGALDAEISGNNIFNMINETSVRITAVEVFNNVENLLISENVIDNIQNSDGGGNGSYGINLQSGINVTDVRIVNNSISRVNSFGTFVTIFLNSPFGIRINGGTNHKVYYNSVNMSGSFIGTGNNYISAAMIVTSSSITGMEVVNNVFYNEMTGTGSVKCYSIYTVSGVSYNSIDYNDYFATGFSGILGFFGFDIFNLTAWRTATGQDNNSISSNPNFFSTSNLVPVSGSPLVNAGLPIVGYTTDILGDARSNTTPTIGAYENTQFTPIIDVGVSSIASPSVGQIINANGSDVIAYVKNFGTVDVTDVDVYYDLNSGTPVGPVVVAGPIIPGDSALVTFTGANQLTSMSNLTGAVTVYTDYPGDGNAGNNSRTVSNLFLRVPPSSFPYFSDFSESPTPYTLSGSASLWGLFLTTNPSGTPSDAAARANFYGVSSGFQILRSTLVDLTGTTNPLLSFYRAYTTWSGGPSNDQLEVLVSTNGGLTWSAPLYQRGWFSVPSLGTLPAIDLPFEPSSAGQWMHNLVDLSAYAGQEVVIGFNAISAHGNNLWIDNIKVSDADNISLIPVNAPGLYGNLATNGVQINFTTLRPGLGNGVITQTDNQELWTPQDVVFGHLSEAMEERQQQEKDGSMISRNTSPVSPDASEGVLALSRIDDFPINNVFETNLTATTFNGAIYTPDVIADRYWEISFSGDDHVSTSTYDVILDISTQLGITAYDSLYIVKRVDQNSPWVCLNTITNYEDGAPVSLIATGLTGFSQFGIASADGTLPVDLVEFNATVDRNNVTLNWTTAWEENNMKFDVQRRPVILPAPMGSGSEESIWSTIGSVAGNGTTQEQKSYSYLDRNLITGKYEYRLVQVDFDGNSTADHTLSNQVEVGIPTEFALSQNYPNPFNPTTKIDFQIPVEGLVKLSVFDMSGREVATLVNEALTPGYYIYTFNGANFASGVYFYRLVTNNSVITKRAVLVK